MMEAAGDVWPMWEFWIDPFFPDFLFKVLLQKYLQFTVMSNKICIFDT